MKPSLTVIVVAASLASGCASQSGGRFYFENDTFGGSDRYFTNAVKLEAYHPPDRHPGWVTWLGLGDTRLFSLKKVEDPKEPGDVASARVGYFVSHYMYTASDRELVDPPKDDRPYAGWLNAGVSASRLLQDDRYQSVSASIGVIGPSAKADQLQSYVHDLRNISKPQGWHTQAKDEPSLDFAFDQRWRATLIGTGEKSGHELFGLSTRMTSNKVDLLPRVGINAGTTFDQVRFGMQLRIGKNLPVDYGAQPIDPTRDTPVSPVDGGPITPSVPKRPEMPPGAMSPEAAGAVSREKAVSSASRNPRSRWNAYAFIDTEGRLVARNRMLDGPLYRKGRSVDSEPFVGEFRYGAVLDTPLNLSVAYIFVMRTHEFKEQEFDQSYGSVQFAWSF